jgi:uncharacterized membrane protein
MNIGLMIFQYLHVLAGCILLGSAFYIYFVLWPALLTRPSAEARAFYESILKRTRIWMAASGGMTFLLGLIRGIVFGQMNTMQAWGTPYGITFSIALAATLAMLIYTPRIGPALLNKVWDGKAFAPNAAQIVKSANALPFLFLIIVLACMVLMHFGL